MGAYDCNPIDSGEDLGGMQYETSPGKKFKKPHLTNKKIFLNNIK
jgi:hypothetical protein